jgi:hypothetical protein
VRAVVVVAVRALGVVVPVPSQDGQSLVQGADADETDAGDFEVVARIGGTRMVVPPVSATERSRLSRS